MTPNEPLDTTDSNTFQPTGKPDAFNTTPTGSEALLSGETPNGGDHTPQDDAPPHDPAQDDMPKTKAAGFGQFSNSVTQAVSRDALFGTSSDLPRVIELALDQIDPNPDQPRKRFDQEKLEELASSIKEVGLVQPITVSKNKDRYLLVAGERRYRAHEILGRETIAAIVTAGEPDLVALIENVQREALDPLEEADAYQQLMERHGYTQAELGKVVGKKQNTISETLSLSRLSPAVIERYRTSDTAPSKNVLVEIAKERDTDRQAALLNEVLDSKLGVRAVRERRKSPTPQPDVPDSVAAANARKNRLIRSLAGAVKRVKTDAKIEDFPTGSEALDRLRELKASLDEELAPILSQQKLNESK